MQNIRVTYIVGTTLLIILLFVICFPRFAAQDIGIVKGKFRPPSDAVKYASYVRILRGQAPYKSVDSPFIYRPLVPLIASYLPVRDPAAAIITVSIISLCLAVLVLMLLFENPGFSAIESLLGGLIFVVSYPVFWCGATGIIDPVSILFIAVGALAAIKRKWGWLVVAIFIGTFAKETVAVLIPASATILIFEKPRNWPGIFIIVIFAFLIPFVLPRIVFPVAGLAKWTPSVEKIIGNLRLRAFSAIILTMGIPGALFLVYLFRRKRIKTVPVAEQRFLIGGIVGSLGLIIVSCIIAYVDGRFAWPFVIFALPLGMAGIGFGKKNFVAKS